MQAFRTVPRLRRLRLIRDLLRYVVNNAFLDGAGNRRMSWEILNANFKRWGTETYPTREAAEQELREFWRGVAGIDLRKFTIQELPPLDWSKLKPPP